MTEKQPEQKQKAKAQKLENPNTRGKNAAGQTNGQWEQDAKRRGGHFTGAGEPPNMRK